MMFCINVLSSVYFGYCCSICHCCSDRTWRQQEIFHFTTASDWMFVFLSTSEMLCQHKNHCQPASYLVQGITCSPVLVYCLSISMFRATENYFFCSPVWPSLSRISVSPHLLDMPKCSNFHVIRNLNKHLNSAPDYFGGVCNSKYFLFVVWLRIKSNHVV